MSTKPDGTLQCDADSNCADSVAYISNKGFIYCTEHGQAKQLWRPCRKLRPHELNRLKRGEPVTRY